MSSDGLHGHLLAGAGVGFLTGTAAVFGYLVVTGLCNGDDDDDFSVAECLVIGGIAGGGPGLVIGGVTGALIRTDRWRGVEPDRLRIALLPSRNGLQLRASLRF